MLAFYKLAFTIDNKNLIMHQNVVLDLDVPLLQN